MKKKKQNEYAASKMRPIVQLVARMVQKNPSLADNSDYLWATVVANIPHLADRSKCGNCDGSMVIYRYTITYLDADLLQAMAKIIADRMKRGIPFTEANKVHVTTMITNHTLAARCSIASKLGLIAKVMKKIGNTETHDREAGWVVTHRGFEFLKGKQTVSSVPVFHNQIVAGAREEFTTISQVYGSRQRGGDWNEIAGVFVEGYSPARLLFDEN